MTTFPSLPSMHTLGIPPLSGGDAERTALPTAVPASERVAHFQPVSATHSCARVTYPPLDLPHSFPFSRSLKPRPPLLGLSGLWRPRPLFKEERWRLREAAGHGLQQGTGWTGRGWSGEKSRAGQGAPTSSSRAQSSASVPHPTAAPPSSLPSPHLEECPWGGGTGNSHLGGGGLGSETLGLVAHLWSGGAGPRSSSQCSLLSYTGGVGGTGGPQAESPPPELFFLGRVFSVLEATGYGERMMGLSLAPRRCRPHSPPPPGYRLQSHLSFGHFFDSFGPLGCLISQVVF